MLCLFAGATKADEWKDDFSNAEQSKTAWVGDWEHFAINKQEQLQSQVSEASESTLLHTSTCAINAEWQCWVRISGTCSAYNQVRFYIALDGEDIYSNGYYVQIGGRNKNITLHKQQVGENKILIENTNRLKIMDNEASTLRIRVTRNDDGVFHLFSWIEGKDSTWMEEGQWFEPIVESQYSALYVKNSKTRGYDFYFDNIHVHGDQQHATIDTETTNEKASVELVSENLSPNQDGWEDQLCLQYLVPNEDYIATCAVYSTNGLLVKQVCHQLPLLESGNICWDGTTTSGNTAQIGVYVLYIELHNKSTHDTLRQRMAVSLTL